MDLGESPSYSFMTDETSDPSLTEITELDRIQTFHDEPRSSYGTTRHRQHKSGTAKEPTDLIPDRPNAEEWPAQAFQIMLFHGSKESFVGFMPTNKFLDEFLPWSKGNTPEQSMKRTNYFPLCAEVTDAKRHRSFVSYTSQKIQTAYSFLIDCWNTTT
jgi:hypothetical protein